MSPALQEIFVVVVVFTTEPPGKPNSIMILTTKNFFSDKRVYTLCSLGF